MTKLKAFIFTLLPKADGSEMKAYGLCSNGKMLTDDTASAMLVPTENINSEVNRKAIKQAADTFWSGCGAQPETWDKFPSLSKVGAVLSHTNDAYMYADFRGELICGNGQVMPIASSRDGTAITLEALLNAKMASWDRDCDPVTPKNTPLQPEYMNAAIEF